jgi:MFS-type transporter involved in bile tolerance (Atg22 family)
VEFTHVEIILETRGKVKENFRVGVTWGMWAFEGRFAAVLAPFLGCIFPNVTRADESDSYKATIV